MNVNDQKQSQADTPQQQFSSREVMQMTGLSRRALSNIVDMGICKPQSNPSTGMLSWTASQVEIARSIADLRSGGLSFNEIAELAGNGVDAYERATHETHMELLRSSRRMVKRSLLQRDKRDSAKSIGVREDTYIRYIPQRYFALIPYNSEHLGDLDDQARLSCILSSVVSCVGWAPAGLGGTLAGAPTVEESTRYVYVELASEPQPAPSTGSADSGCYNEFGGSCAHEHGKADCEFCSYFGRSVANGDELAWKDHTSGTMASKHTVMASDLARSYPCGPWSRYTRRLLGEQRSDEPPVAAARPQLMPHEVPLPAGVTACVMPAGYYLCRQCDPFQQARSILEFVGATHLLQRREMTVADEVVRAARIDATTSHRNIGRATSSFDLIDGIARIGDSSAIGRFKPFDSNDIPRMRVLTGTGLTPDSDYTIVCENIPLDDHDATPRVELQTLIDIEPEAPSPQALGIVARPALHAEKNIDRLMTTRCHMCGSQLETEWDESVAVCNRCGYAQGVPVAPDGDTALRLERAANLLFEKRFEEASQVYRKLSAMFPGDAELHWEKLLSKLGVTYHLQPLNDRYVPKLENAPSTPIYEDDDCRAALAAATQSQWPIYLARARALECERLESLGLPAEMPPASAFCTSGGDAAGAAEHSVRITYHEPDREKHSRVWGIIERCRKHKKG